MRFVSFALHRSAWHVYRSPLIGRGAECHVCCLGQAQWWLSRNHRLHNNCANLSPTMAKFINADSEGASDSSPQESPRCQQEGWFASSLFTECLINRQLAISSLVCARTPTHLSAVMTMCANCTSAVNACMKRQTERERRLPVRLPMSSSIG